MQAIPKTLQEKIKLKKERELKQAMLSAKTDAMKLTRLFSHESESVDDEFNEVSSPLTSTDDDRPDE